MGINQITNSALRLIGVTTGILAWRWAQRGVSDNYDRAIMTVLVCMNTIAGIAFLQKAGLKPPPTMLLLGTSAMTVVSQLL